MRLTIEEGDFPAHTGKSVEELADPLYGFTVVLSKEPNRRAIGIIKHHGSGFRVEGVAVEIAGKELDATDVLIGPADKPEAKPAKAGRNSKGQFVKAEPALTGPVLQDMSAWSGE